MTNKDIEQVTQTQPNVAPAARVWPLPWWSALSLLVLIGFVAVLVWVGIVLLDQPLTSVELPTAIFVTVTPAGNQRVPSGPQVTAEPAVTHVAPAQFKPGDWVQVSGTAGMGVRLRSGPGVLYETLKLVPEGTRLEVTGEPRQADNYVWWPVHLDDVYGWIVSDYLEIAVP